MSGHVDIVIGQQVPSCPQPSAEWWTDRTLGASNSFSPLGFTSQPGEHFGDFINQVTAFKPDIPCMLRWLCPSVVPVLRQVIDGADDASCPGETGEEQGSCLTQLVIDYGLRAKDREINERINTRMGFINQAPPRQLQGL